MKSPAERIGLLKKKLVEVKAQEEALNEELELLELEVCPPTYSLFFFFFSSSLSRLPEATIRLFCQLQILSPLQMVPLLLLHQVLLLQIVLQRHPCPLQVVVLLHRHLRQVTVLLHRPSIKW